METDQQSAASGAGRRSGIEALLARYPDLSQEELGELKQWFTREASSLDVALLASVESIRPGYRQFRADHIDRFSAKDILIAAVVLGAAAGAFALVAFPAF